MSENHFIISPNFTVLNLNSIDVCGLDEDTGSLKIFCKNRETIVLSGKDDIVSVMRAMMMKCENFEDSGLTTETLIEKLDEIEMKIKEEKERRRKRKKGRTVTGADLHLATFVAVED